MAIEDKESGEIKVTNRIEAKPMEIPTGTPENNNTNTIKNNITASTINPL